VHVVPKEGRQVGAAGGVAYGGMLGQGACSVQYGGEPEGGQGTPRLR
jgi:hypothetical protein